MAQTNLEQFETDSQTIEDIPVDELVGTHTYEGVLYTGETDVVDITTGNTPSDLNRSVEEARDFADRVSDEGKPPRVAVKQPPGPAIESRSPYVASVFCDRKITGGMDYHKAFLELWRSDEYRVTHVANYRTGTLTISVEQK